MFRPCEPVSTVDAYDAYWSATDPDPARSSDISDEVPESFPLDSYEAFHAAVDE